MKDYYAVLGLDRNASDEDIKKAYRQSALKYHPDRNPSDASAAQKFNEVNEAYEALSDPAKRKQHDYATSQNQPGGPGFGFNFNFDPFFSFINMNMETRDVDCDIHLIFEISLDESIKGSMREVEVQKRELCKDCGGQGGKDYKICATCAGKGRLAGTPHGPFLFHSRCGSCHGTGRTTGTTCSSCSGMKFKLLPPVKIAVRIPPGLTEGHTIRMGGNGHPNLGGGCGDLILTVKVQPHEYFTRNGLDIICDVPVTFSELVLGTTLQVPRPEGGVIAVTVPAGTESGHPFRVWGLGLVNIQNAAQKGDLIVVVKLSIPTELDDEYHQAMFQLKRQEEKNIDPLRKQFESLAAT